MCETSDLATAMHDSIFRRVRLRDASLDLSNRQDAPSAALIARVASVELTVSARKQTRFLCAQRACTHNQVFTNAPLAHCCWMALGLGLRLYTPVSPCVCVVEVERAKTSRRRRSCAARCAAAELSLRSRRRRAKAASRTDLSLRSVDITGRLDRLLHSYSKGGHN